MATELVAVEPRRKYNWPEAQLNFWLFIMLCSFGTTLGIFAWFMTVQTQLNLGVPWLFPFMVTVSSMGVAFIILILVLIQQRSLLPGIVLIGTFILFVLCLTGMIQTAIMAFGTSGAMSICDANVNNAQPTGVSILTLAWLTQKNICNCWSTVFAFTVVEVVFLVWMMVMAYQVNNDDFD